MNQDRIWFLNSGKISTNLLKWLQPQSRNIELEATAAVTWASVTWASVKCINAIRRD